LAEEQRQLAEWGHTYALASVCKVPVAHL
jgi:hypothetical protein